MPSRSTVMRLSGLRQVLGHEPEIDGVLGQLLQHPSPARAWSRSASRRGTSAPAICRPSGCCPRGSRSRPCRSKNHSDRASFGTGSDSAPWRWPGRPGWCGTCSCAPPGRSRWRGHGDVCRSRTSAAASPSWPRRRRRTTMPPRKIFTCPFMLHDHFGDGSAFRVRIELHDLGMGEQGDIRMLQRGPHRRALRHPTWRGRGRESRRNPCSARRCCRACSPR